MLVGIYIGQFCITTLTWFFITWFPVYLARRATCPIVKVGFAAALPALCGSIGGSSRRHLPPTLSCARGHSLTFARKAPIVAGMLLSVSMIACNYTDAQWLRHAPASRSPSSAKASARSAGPSSPTPRPRR